VALFEDVFWSSDGISGAAMTRGPSSTALLIMGYRNEFTRGVLTASGSIIVVGILATA
jgi:hypothetical protein